MSIKFIRQGNERNPLRRDFVFRNILELPSSGTLPIRRPSPKAYATIPKTQGPISV